MTDILQVLDSDHAAVRRDLDAVLDPAVGADHDRRRELLDQLMADVVRHFVGEEQYLLPAVRERMADGAAVSDETIGEHRAIEDELRRLTDADLDSAAVGEVLDAFGARFGEHVARQQGVVVPFLQTLDARERDELGEQMLGAEYDAPTHPRAIIVESAVANKLLSYLEGLAEKTVDSFGPHERAERAESAEA